MTLSALTAGCQSPTPDTKADPVTLQSPSGTNDRASAANYHPQVGDRLSAYTLDDAVVISTRIKPDGTVTFAGVGTFQAAGKSMRELHQELLAKNPRLQGLVLPCECMIYVTGEVNSPGPKQCLPGTVLKAIHLAGGLTKNADRKRIQLIRANGRKEAFSYDKALGGNAPMSRHGDGFIVRRKG